MNKEELANYIFYEKERKEIINQIKYLQETQGCNEQIFILKNRMCEIVLNQLKIEYFIKNINNCEIRLIVMLKYIKGYTWLKIAFLIGGNDEQYPRRKLDRYLHKISKNRV